MKNMSRLLTAICLTALISGCVSIGSDSEPVTLFRLNPVTTPVDVDEPLALKLSISSGSLLNSQRLWVYRDGTQVAGFAGARWAMTLPEMFRQTLISSLEQSGTAIVLEPPARVPTLRVAIRDFQVEEGDNGAQAVVAIKATWIGLEGDDIRHRLIRATENVSLNSADSVARAMNAVNQKVVRELHDWLLGNN